MINIYLSDKSAAAKIYFVFENHEVFNIKVDLSQKNNCFTKALSKGFAFENSYDNKEKIIWVNIGKKEKLTPEIFRDYVSRLVNFCEQSAIESIGVDFLIEMQDKGEYVKALIESALMSSYQYMDYLSDKRSRVLESLYLNIEETFKDAVRESISLGNAVNVARDLVNEPANVQTPQKLAEEVMDLGKKHGFEVEILNEEEIIALNMKAFHQVSKGAHHKPRFIIMRYLNLKSSDEILGLVGKGVTYDSGGLNLKSGPRFMSMKHDMAGGASVIGAMCAIAKENIKTNVVAVIAACENLISSQAYKPGDIINSRANKTILVSNTDAEGRLTLIDALDFIIKDEKVSKVLDIATLTGSARKMFGYFAAPFVCNKDSFCNIFQEALKQSGEAMYKMPLIEEAVDFISCDIADYVNASSSETCGMITSALFLREFVDDIPWIHIDAAGPLWLEHPYKYHVKGGTGFGCRSLYYLAKAMA